MARAQPHSNLAIALIQLGRNDEALAALDNALRIKPAYPEALANRGNVLRELGRLDEALESYERALGLRPAEVAIQLNRGELLHALGRPEDALATSERVLESHPTLPRALVLRGNALRSLHRHALALASYERALQSDAGHFGALVGSGNALQSLHRHLEALDAYKRALAQQPDALEVLNNRGAVLRDLKRYADAAESFRLLEAARPDWDYVESNRLHSQLYCCESSRADCGLPEKGFVFCCFNNNYKISPDVFQAWMRLLKGTAGSVLWLLEDNPDASRNLRSEANRSGVAPERLVFARRLPVDEHLVRQRLADLFLDTLPCNAHTTASDALWAGLPVLTCTGRTFAGRVASSLLHALELPELVMPDPRQWEEMAGLLAANPKRLLAIRGKLAGKRLTAPLFDTDRTRLHLESAYRTMWQRHLRGEAPGAFTVVRAP